jgi:PhnB protein
MQINTYLTFNGNCREAMNFYNDCLEGVLYFQTIGDSPLADKMPAQMKAYILHSTITKGALVLMGSDMVSNAGLQKGNAVSLMLACDSEATIENYYASLSEGGQQDHPLEHTFFGSIMGDLTDKFGNHWLLNFDKNQPQ